MGHCRIISVTKSCHFLLRSCSLTFIHKMASVHLKIACRQNGVWPAMPCTCVLMVSLYPLFKCIPLNESGACSAFMKLYCINMKLKNNHSAVYIVQNSVEACEVQHCILQIKLNYTQEADC